MKAIKGLDWRAITIQLGALTAHLGAVAHHTYRLGLALAGRDLPRGL